MTCIWKWFYLKRLNVVRLYRIVWFTLASWSEAASVQQWLFAELRLRAAEFKVPCAVSQLWRNAAGKVCRQSKKKKNPKKTTTSIYSMIKKACFLTLSFVFYLYLFSLHMLIERSGVVPVFLKHKRTCIKVFVDPSFVCFTSVLLEFTLHWRFEHLWFLKVDKYLSYLLPLRYGWLR